MVGKNIAIITARGGSKRIPRKNIKDFYGKPIISYSITAALDSGIFDEVMVSTDDKEIADIARRCGANVPFLRSEKASTDTASTKDVLLEVLGEYEKRGKTFDRMCCIYPTAPFVTGDKIVNAMKLLMDKEVQQVVPVVAYSYPPQRSQKIDDKGLLEYRFPEHVLTRSQDLEPWYHDAGQFYCYDVKKYIACEGMCTENMPFIVSELEVQDIDNETDWKLAEMKYEIMLKKKTKKVCGGANWL